MPKKKLEADASYFINNLVDGDEFFNFVSMPTIVFDSLLSELSNREFIVFVYMVRLYFGKKTRYSKYQKIETITEGTKLTEDQIKKILNSLMKKGLVIEIINSNRQEESEVFYKVRTDTDPIDKNNRGQLINTYYQYYIDHDNLD